MARPRLTEQGFTLVELTVTITVFAIVALSLMGLFVSLTQSTILAKRQAVALSLATNQMEYLKSLPYDNLAVAGGSIYSASPIPASKVQTLNGVKYTITTSVNYVDDAYDGCASYPNAALKALYCRNQPAPSTAPAVDTNPQDYKIAHVSVTDSGTRQLAKVDTEISARVSETASTTGALFVTVIDGGGNPVSGANVTVVNNTLTPNVSLGDTSDGNGTAIFYGLKPDSGTDYLVTAAKSGYSTLATIAPSGTLQPTYPSQKVITQQSSYVTLTIKPQGPNSLAIEAVNTTGAALANLKVYAKGGYKKYVSTSDNTYYYDNVNGGDSRPVTDGSGLAALSNLVPGNYWLCGDTGATSCQVGSTTYYLAAAVPYGGTSAFSPVVVPTYDPANPPSATYTQGSTAYYQKVRMIMTTSSSFPRISGLSPASVAKSDSSITNFAFTLNGANLPCSATASSCATTVAFTQGAASYPASCTGTSAGTQLSCTVNLSSAAVGKTGMTVTSGSQTLTIPGDPLIGGITLGS